ncbi:killer cell lectin-like receptor subfamily G member 1 isoform X1 [Octodon degus]|uniref:Killer cell lectin-like receptor subfamily G member 1 isoform X1 n=1 Tax=Octodon degus TaxID=10160 RepID=A0A6P3FUI3_OCTDE|nr:killer cell lectin-like receptor subfamily G member 1 isoform X1 [Octodon degus]
MERRDSAIYSTVELPTVVEAQDDCRLQRKALPSRSCFFCLVTIAMGLLNILLMSLLLYHQILCHGLHGSTRASCPSCPDFWVKYGNHCYYFSVEKKDWNSSLEFCTASDAHLLRLMDNQEMSHIQHLINKDYYWIGLRKNSSWRWEDGSALNFSRVSSNSFVQRCGVINVHGLQSSSCEVPLQWICKKLRL